MSFLVIYLSNCHFYKCQPNTQLFQKALFNSFYQTLSFLKKHFFIMHFLKTPLFHYALFQKAEPNSPLIQVLIHSILSFFFFFLSFLSGWGYRLGHHPSSFFSFLFFMKVRRTSSYATSTIRIHHLCGLLMVAGLLPHICNVRF